MQILMERHGNQTRAVLLCEECTEPITGAGIVLWNPSLTGQGTIPRYVHKKCQTMTDRGLWWDELHYHLLRLIVNQTPGCTPRDLHRLVDRFCTHSLQMAEIDAALRGAGPSEDEP